MVMEVLRSARVGAVVVVGTDLNEVSEHLLATVRDLVCSYRDVELHLVHVVARERLPKRLVKPPDRRHASDALASGEAIKMRVKQLCEEIALRPGARLVIHTPVGNASQELTRVARKVRANLLVLEAQNRQASHPMFTSSTVGRIATTAPCSVLTLRSRLEPARSRSRTAPLTANSLGASFR